MQDALLVIEAYLDLDGVAHSRDNEGVLCFCIPFGSTAYECRIRRAGAIVHLEAIWVEQIGIEDVERAQSILSRLCNATPANGSTGINRSRGEVRYRTSIDLTFAPLTVEQVGRTLEIMLDPFNVRLVAMGYVLNGELPEDAAVECYKEWDENRLASLMRGWKSVDDVDPSQN